MDTSKNRWEIKKQEEGDRDSEFKFSQIFSSIIFNKKFFREFMCDYQNE